jgi:hypothetical protein
MNPLRRAPFNDAGPEPSIRASIGKRKQQMRKQGPMPRQIRHGGVDSFDQHQIDVIEKAIDRAWAVIK